MTAKKIATRNSTMPKMNENAERIPGLEAALDFELFPVLEAALDFELFATFLKLLLAFVFLG